MRLQVVSADLVPTLKSKKLSLCVWWPSTLEQLTRLGLLASYENCVFYSLLKNLPLVFFTVCSIFWISKGLEIIVTVAVWEGHLWNKIGQSQTKLMCTWSLYVESKLTLAEQCYPVCSCVTALNCNWSSGEWFGKDWLDVRTCGKPLLYTMLVSVLLLLTGASLTEAG